MGFNPDQARAALERQYGQTPTKETVIETKPLTQILTNRFTGAEKVTTEQKTIALPPDFQFGTRLSAAWEEVNQQDKAEVGDTLQITYQLRMRFLQQWQEDYLVSKLSNDSRYEIISIATNQEEGKMVVELKVLQPFSPVILVAVAVVAVLVGAAIFVSVTSIRRLGTVKLGKTEVNLTPILIFGVIVLIGWSFLRKGGVAV